MFVCAAVPSLLIAQMPLWKSSKLITPRPLGSKNRVRSFTWNHKHTVLNKHEKPHNLFILHKLTHHGLHYHTFNDTKTHKHELILLQKGKNEKRRRKEMWYYLHICKDIKFSCTNYIIKKQTQKRRGLILVFFQSIYYIVFRNKTLYKLICNSRIDKTDKSLSIPDICW